MSDGERTVQRQLKIITEPSIAAIVELYFNKYNTHIPKGSTDSTGIREKSDRDSKTQRARERERGSGRQTGVAMATSGDSGAICRHRIQFGMSMTFPTRSSLPAEASFHCLACLLFIYCFCIQWVWFGYSYTLTLSRVYLSCVFDHTNDSRRSRLKRLRIRCWLAALGRFRAGHYCIASRKSSRNERNFSR